VRDDRDRVQRAIGADRKKRDCSDNTMILCIQLDSIQFTIYLWLVVIEVGEGVVGGQTMK